MKVIIIGGGQTGMYIASLLTDNKCSVTVIDNREHVIEKLSKDAPLSKAVLGNGTDPDVLEAAGIRNSDALVAVTGADEVNLVASTIAKFEFGVPRVVGRINSPKNAWLFNAQMGVDISLNQADILSHLVIEEIDLKHIFTLLKLSMGSYSIVQIEVDPASEAVGRTIKDLGTPPESKLILLSRGKDVLLPVGDTVIFAGDVILALANENARVQLDEMFGGTEKHNHSK